MNDRDNHQSTTVHCSVPGCYSPPVFAGLCNLHSTRGIHQTVDQRKAEDRRGNRPEIATDIPAGTTATASNPGFAIDAATIYKSDLNTTSAIGHDRRGTDAKMSEKYPKYYKDIPAGVDSLDIYAVCLMFNVNDAALSHALKKIMLPGVRTGNKTRRDDIKEARDTLNRWLELHK